MRPIVLRYGVPTCSSSGATAVQDGSKRLSRFAALTFSKIDRSTPAAHGHACKKTIQQNLPNYGRRNIAKLKATFILRKANITESCFHPATLPKMATFYQLRKETSKRKVPICRRQIGLISKPCRKPGEVLLKCSALRTANWCAVQRQANWLQSTGWKVGKSI